MNKFLTFEGEQPVYLGDIDFMQNNTRTALLQILKGITGEPTPTCIIQGCKVYDKGVMSGVVCLDGELYDVATTVMSEEPYLQVVTTYEGSRLMKSGERRECYEIRTASVTSEVTAYKLADMPRLDDLLSRGLDVGLTASADGTSIRVRKRGTMFSVRGVYMGIDKTLAGWQPGMLSSLTFDLRNVLTSESAAGTVVAAIYNIAEGSYEAAPVIVKAAVTDGQMNLSFNQWIDSGYKVELSFIIEKV